MRRGKYPEEPEGVYAGTTPEGIEYTEEEIPGGERDPFLAAEYVEKVAKELRKKVEERIKDKEKREIYLEEIKRLEENADLDGLLSLSDEIEKAIEEETRSTKTKTTKTTTETKTERKKKEEPVEKKGKERIKEVIERSEEAFAPTRTVLQKENFIFDARPHLSFYAIPSRDPRVKSLKALAVEEWANVGDLEDRIVPHMLLGGSDEVKNFYNMFKKEDLQILLDYEVIVDDRNKRLILKVSEDYFKLENNITGKLREIYGIYGENELKRFLRAGLITEIVRDRNFNFERIREKHGNYKISLEIGDIIREDTSWTLNKFVAKGFSPGLVNTFTDQLRIEHLNKNIVRFGIKKGYLLIFLRDNARHYQTIDGVIQRNFEIGKAFEEGAVGKLPFGERTIEYRGFVETGKAVETWRVIRQIALETIQSGKPDFLKHFSNLMDYFPDVIWDYVSNYEPRKKGGSELMHFLNFITSQDEKYKRNLFKGKGKMNYWEGYEIFAKQGGIELSKVSFPEKVKLILNEYISMMHTPEEGTFNIDIEKLTDMISDERIQKGLLNIFKFAEDMEEANRVIRNAVEEYVKGIESYEKALREVKEKFEEIAKRWGYRVNSEGIEGYFKEVAKIVEEYVKQTGRMPEDLWKEINEVAEMILKSRRMGTAIVPVKKGTIIPFQQELERMGIWEKILENAKAKGLFSEGGIKRAMKNDFDKLGEILGEHISKGIFESPFFKAIGSTIYLKRLAKFGGIIGALIGVGYGIYHLFFKDKKGEEKIKSPALVVEEGKGGEAIRKEEVEEKFRPIYLFPNLWKEYKAARENYKQAVQSYTRGILNFILMSSIFADAIDDIPASDLIRLKVLAEWEGKDFSKLAQGYVVAKRRGITPKTLDELEFYAGIEEPDRMKIDKIASMLEKIYNMNVKMNERLLMQAYDRYKMFMRANIDIIKAQFREWQKRQTLLWKAKELQQNNARELGLLLAIEAQRKEKEEKATGR